MTESAHCWVMYSLNGRPIGGCPVPLQIQCSLSGWSAETSGLGKVDSGSITIVQMYCLTRYYQWSVTPYVGIETKQGVGQERKSSSASSTIDRLANSHLCNGEIDNEPVELGGSEYSLGRRVHGTR